MAPRTDLIRSTTSSADPGALEREDEHPASPRGEPASERRPKAGWPLGRRIAFRFLCVYLVLYYLPAPIGMIPGTEGLAELYDRPWRALAVWVGRHVLHLRQDITVFGGDSTDTTYNYVQLFCWFVIASAATILWSILDRRRSQYRELHGWLRVYARYMVAMAMVSYGALKVFKLQFPFPSPDRLMQSYGDSAPHELLWNFMGYSRGYTFFTGAAEVLGGVLLLSRRTTTLGALVVMAVMANVVMLDFCYDVPVKLLSSHLLLTAIFLLLPDLKRLADVLLRNRPSEAMDLAAPRFAPGWMSRGRVAVKVLFIGSMVFSASMIGVMSYSRGDSAPRPPLYGLYEVEAFVRNGEAVAPAVTEAERWRWVAVNERRMLVIKLMDDSTQRYRLALDQTNRVLTLTPRGAPGEPEEKFALSYARPDDHHLVLQGTFKNDSLTVTVRRVVQSKFLLVSREFQWISERPFNR
jgi:uncharacterized membrane protein YphA (DoxX/SURF4 family)